jgi:hypothetical protein
MASWFTTLAVLYVVFFVQVGRRTLWQHAVRIAGTQEAQELGHDAVDMSHHVVDRARDGIERGIPEARGLPPRVRASRNAQHGVAAAAGNSTPRPAER